MKFPYGTPLMARLDLQNPVSPAIREVEFISVGEKDEFTQVAISKASIEQMETIQAILTEHSTGLDFPLSIRTDTLQVNKGEVRKRNLNIL